MPVNRLGDWGVHLGEAHFAGGLMFGNGSRRETFEREVRIEMEHLRKLHDDDAPRVAAEKAVRPTNRTLRRKVLEETARRLSGPLKPARKRFLSRLLGSN